MLTWIDAFVTGLGQELSRGLPDGGEAARISVRLVVALLIGGILGWERQHLGKAAGLRTHLLVALGAAIVILIPELSNNPSNELGRILQGILTGIGFIGGGTILKLSAEGEIKGLTTAASIWLTAVGGSAAGVGCLGLGLAAAGLGLLILFVLGKYENLLMGGGKQDPA